MCLQNTVQCLQQYFTFTRTASSVISNSVIQKHSVLLYLNIFCTCSALKHYCIIHNFTTVSEIIKVLVRALAIKGVLQQLCLIWNPVQQKKRTAGKQIVSANYLTEQFTEIRYYQVVPRKTLFTVA